MVFQFQDFLSKQAKNVGLKMENDATAKQSPPTTMIVKMSEISTGLNN